VEEPEWLASGADARGVLVKITSPGPEREHGAQLRDDAGTLKMRFLVQASVTFSPSTAQPRTR
jgi:hypothetical protein